MHIKTIVLKNFRNIGSNNADKNSAGLIVNLALKRNILVGENAQGKTNFLEAIEFISRGKSSRSTESSNLINLQSTESQLKISYEKQGFEKEVQVKIRKSEQSKSKQEWSINGITTRPKNVLGRELITVSFTRDDLDLLRGGPKFRRDWLDDVILSIRPQYDTILTTYQKTLAQKNKLLKLYFENQTETNSEQLQIWTRQLIKAATQLIRIRIHTLKEIQPLAKEFYNQISQCKEELSFSYKMYLKQEQETFAQPFSQEDLTYSLNDLAQLDERAIALILLKECRQREEDEIARRQSLVGPHRDDIEFRLNDQPSTNFASQGQQRSLVLALKLAQLELLKQRYDEAPVLLLDDVLAELDVHRQHQLLASLGQNIQTIITTTHLSSFDPQWLEGSLIFNVKSGNIYSQADNITEELTPTSSGEYSYY